MPARLGSLSRFKNPKRLALLCRFIQQLRRVVPRFEWTVHSDSGSKRRRIRGIPINAVRSTLTVCPITAIYICRFEEEPESAAQAAKRLGYSRIAADLIYAIDEQPESELGCWICSALQILRDAI